MRVNRNCAMPFDKSVNLGTYLIHGYNSRHFTASLLANELTSALSVEYEVPHPCLPLLQALSIRTIYTYTCGVALAHPKMLSIALVYQFFSSKL